MVTRSRTGAIALLSLLLLALTACVIETEGRSDEAQATLTRYLAGLAGGADDRGWSMLSESVRGQFGATRDYVELADLAADAPLPIRDVRLTYGDDGFYEFTVTTTGPIDAAYAEVLFHRRLGDSVLACPTEPDAFRIAVIIAPFSEFAGVTATGCSAEK